MPAPYRRGDIVRAETPESGSFTVKVLEYLGPNGPDPQYFVESPLSSGEVAGIWLAARWLKPGPWRDSTPRGHFTRIVDDMLVELPEAKKDQFIKSDDFPLYRRVASGGEVGEADWCAYVHAVDDLLGELPEKSVTRFMATPEYEVYRRVAGDCAR